MRTRQLLRYLKKLEKGKYQNQRKKEKFEGDWESFLCRKLKPGKEKETGKRKKERILTKISTGKSVSKVI
jgi:hypothetical protein